MDELDRHIACRCACIVCAIAAALAMPAVVQAVLLLLLPHAPSGVEAHAALSLVLAATIVVVPLLVRALFAGAPRTDQRLP